jgi:hypothetical protein
MDRAPCSSALRPGSSQETALARAGGLPGCGDPLVGGLALPYEALSIGSCNEILKADTVPAKAAVALALTVASVWPSWPVAQIVR